MNSERTVADPLRPVDLRCEHRKDPAGIDRSVPRLSWSLDGGTRATTQGAWQVRAASSPADLERGEADLWDSGQVAGDEQTLVPWGGASLGSRARVTWQVRVWDGNGEPSAWSAPAHFELGLLDPGEWEATWITHHRPVEVSDDFRPSPYLRRAFNLPSKPVRARLYVTALGVYEARLNGQRVGDDLFRPGWTDYMSRLQYDTYDVTPQLHEGPNAIGALLGDGWYAGFLGPGRVTGMGKEREVYGSHPQLMARLDVELGDGTRVVVTTDRSWRGSFGPVLMSDFQMGERYDARLEQPGWDTPTFDDTSWEPARLGHGSVRPLVWSAAPPVREIETVVPTWITRLEDGRFLIDFGQNLVGYARLHIAGAPAGAQVTLRFAEMLTAEGDLYVENLRAARSTDSYVCRGDAAETWQPVFTFHGFRYAEVTGWPHDDLAPDDIEAVVVHSDLEITGDFTCNDELINQLQSNVVWGQRGNFLEVPTDCPQRDERLGWTGDAQVFVGTACFNMDGAGFFTKWLDDLADAQSVDGLFPPIAPRLWEATEASPGYIGSHGPAWGDAGVIVPWITAMVYDDMELLTASYPRARAWVDAIHSANPDGLWRNARGQDFGDWLSIHADTPKEVLATAYLAHSTDLVARMARKLGRDVDAVHYEERFREIRQAFIDEYVYESGMIRGDTQTVYALALRFGLLPDAVRSRAAARLVADIEARDWHLSTGFIGVSHLLPALSEAGHLDVAYRLLHQDTFPSWLFPIHHGATTMWEHWDGWTPDRGFQDPHMLSFNHYAFGSVGQWLYETVAGLSPLEPGYRRVQVRPRPGGNINQVAATYRSVRGAFAVTWARADDRFDLVATLPPNTAGRVHLPTWPGAKVFESSAPVDVANGVQVIEQTDDEVVCDVGSGTYTFSVE